ncbi:hypothetical protein [Cellulomonas shaoxiangyii]|uniref:Uncharacterized protein n=1 Tax=Cellulomonas shaoxiangyii TaxID=2566013 RepID=A0A4P7SH50_9CELL|nr:hypothetical protein [Cellulomonas shaoxiangyii]QCB93280.1 hypothetical protein E5225_06680 [Cellulomonas shaoxiangyii]TGY78649.1 hypothetical protein E5226_16090 [Cellulomonas shaoxiangyii]
MALFSRRRRLPDAVRRRLDLLPDDAVLAAAPLDGGRWAVVSRRALHLVDADPDAPVARAPWSDVDRGTLDAEARTLTVHWVSGARTDLPLADDPAARDVAQTFRERVQQSVVHVEHVTVPTGGRVRVALRRDEDGDLFTQAIGDARVDLRDPATARAVAAAEARVRDEVGLGS